MVDLSRRALSPGATRILQPMNTTRAEMIMSHIVSTNAGRQSAASEFFGRMAKAIRRGWDIYRAWHIQEATIAYLKSLSDRELKDIGLTREQIDCAVRGALKIRFAIARDS
jgi:uncharacterized protein YjiS (DUF1127 family)